MSRLSSIQKRIAEKKGIKSSLLRKKRKLSGEIKELKKEMRASEKAQAFIQTIAGQTQSTLKVHISEITSLAMSSVFQRPYMLEVDFVPKRGKTEMPIVLRRDGRVSNPKFSSGGVKEIVALGTQLSCWSLPSAGKRTRAILFLDEPLKWLKGAELPQRGARVIQEIAKELGMQIIQVSHSPELIEHSDHVFAVHRRGERSIVEEKS